MTDLYKEMQEDKREAQDVIVAEKCLIATTATSETDDVYVTFPFSPAPSQQEIIDYWKPGVHGNGSVRYPTRGDVGAALTLDTGELWLIF